MIDKKQVKVAKETVDFLMANYEWFTDEFWYTDLTNKEFNTYVEKHKESLSFWFPEEDECKISLKEFVELSNEIKTLTVVDNSFLTTKNRSYFIISSDHYFHEILLEGFQTTLETTNKIEIKLVSNSFIVGLAAMQLEAWEKHWGSFYSYSAIELNYKENQQKLNREQELELVKAYMFEIADTAGIALTFDKIEIPFKYYEPENETGTKNLKHLRDLEPFNEGMSLFISAIQITEPELKFLNFYKILEYFAPISVNVEAHELMRKKLDSPKILFEDGDFIKSIFDLAKSVRNKFNDEDLINSTFSNCFDFVGLFEKLPENIKKKVKKNIQLSKLDYSVEKQKVATASNMVSKIVYSTRNVVVHAKSNYVTNGNECAIDDLPILNEFMKEAASQSIRWYNRQPSHLKRMII